MNALTALADLAPTAEHIGDDDLPWIESPRMAGVETKLSFMGSFRGAITS